MQRIARRETAAEKAGRHVKIAGQAFVLRRSDVTRASRRLEPEPIAQHYVVVGSRRYPPKQLIAAVTGLDRADFTTHQARRTLMRLGFVVGRRETPSPKRRAAQATERPARGLLVDRLRSHAGEWVAIKDDDVLHAASSPQGLVGWLSAHGQEADSVFRVPDDAVAATGLAPL